MKKLFLFLLAPALLFAQTPWNGTANTAWYNESASAYTITTAEQLAGLAQLVNNGTTSFEGKTITLGANIALNDTNAQGGWRNWGSSTTGLRQWVPIGNSSHAFRGNFNGNGKVVRGLYIKNSAEDNQGLFGVASGGSISNLGLVGFYVSGRVNVGSVIGGSCTSMDNTATHYCANGALKPYGSVQDAAGNTYKTIVIGTQTWMAENLNYNVSGSVCYGNDPANCAKYGRLYNWATAMALPSSCNTGNCTSQVQSKHCGICPEGWHIPSDTEWTVLADYVGGSSTAGTKLKATSGWNDNGNGTDNYGFSALPGGLGLSAGSFFIAGNYGFWWSSSEYGVTSGVWGWVMHYNYGDADRYDGDKSRLFSVRCLKD